MNAFERKLVLVHGHGNVLPEFWALFATWSTCVRAGKKRTKAKSGELLSLLEKANVSFAKVEERKDYHAHLKEGQKAGIRADTNLDRSAVRQGKRQAGR